MYIKLRNNINFYYKNSENSLYVSNYKQMYSVSLNKVEYQQFKEFYNYLYSNVIRKSDIEKWGQLKTKFFKILLKCDAFYQAEYEAVDFALFSMLKKYATNPTKQLLRIQNTSIVLIHANDERHKEFANKINHELQKIGFRTVLYNQDDKIRNKAHNEYQIYIGNILIDRISQQYNGYIHYDNNLVFSYFSEKLMNSLETKEVYRFYCQKGTYNPIHMDFVFNIFFKVFPYFLTQQFLDVIDTNVIFIDGNMFPQYQKYEKGKIVEVESVNIKKKIRADVFPEIDKEINKKDYFIKRIALENDGKHVFNMEVELCDDNKIYVGARTYTSAYEQAILTAFEKQNKEYCLTSISNIHFPKTREVVCHKISVSGRLEFRKKLYSFYNIVEYIDIQYYQNGNIQLAIISDNMNNIYAIEIKDMESWDELDERVIVKYLNRKRNQLPNLGKVSNIFTLDIKKKYQFKDLHLFTLKEA